MEENIYKCPFCGRRRAYLSSYRFDRDKYKAKIVCKCGWSLEAVDLYEILAKNDVIQQWNSIRVLRD